MFVSVKMKTVSETHDYKLRVIMFLVSQHTDFFSLFNKMVLKLALIFLERLI